MDERKIQEAMDACRPGSDDLHLPELKPLADSLPSDPARQVAFARVQRLDVRLGAAVRDVAVPEGLAARILGRIETASTSACGLAPAARMARSETGGVTEISKPIASNRRKWIARVAAVAAAVAVTATMWALWPRHESLSRDRLLAQSAGWHSQLIASAGWTRLPPHEMLRDYPLSAAVRAGAERWLDASDAVGQDAVAYELATPAGRRATLFVIPARDAVAGATPPLTPQSSTGGVMIGCWQSQGMVYVLVVEGDERSYQSLLDASPQPLA